MTTAKTPVLAPEEARVLIDSIAITTIAGLRDRALIGLMVFSFARIGAVLGMKVEDVYTQNRRLWVRLREKGGKPHAMPCHAITTLRLTSPPTSRARVSPQIPKGRSSGPSTVTRVVRQRALPCPGECLCDGRAASWRGQHRDDGRPIHLCDILKVNVIKMHNLRVSARAFNTNPR